MARSKKPDHNSVAARLALQAHLAARSYSAIHSRERVKQHLQNLRERRVLGTRLLRVWFRVVEQLAVDPNMLRLIADDELESAMNATYYWPQDVLAPDGAMVLINALSNEKQRRLRRS